MKKIISSIVFLIFAVVAFATPQFSGNGGYVFRYSDNKIIQALRDVNTYSMEIGNHFTAKIQFTLMESQALADSFALNCNAPFFSQSSMANLTFDELYLLYNGTNTEIKVGKFYTSWGTSPITNPVNVLEPYNFTDIFNSPIRKSILGVQTTRWFTNGSSLELDVVPVFTPDALPSLPSTDIENVSPTFKNMQFGARYSDFLGNYNVAVDMYHGFVHAYVPSALGVLYHPILNAIGGEFSGPMPLNSNYNIYGEGMMMMTNSVIDFTGLIGMNGFIFGQTTGLEIVRGLPGQAPGNFENAVLLYFNRNVKSNMVFNGTATLGLTDSGKMGYLVAGYLDYQPTQDISLIAGANWAAGEEGEYFESQNSSNGFYLKGIVYF